VEIRRVEGRRESCEKLRIVRVDSGVSEQIVRTARQVRVLQAGAQIRNRSILPLNEELVEPDFVVIDPVLLDLLVIPAGAQAILRQEAPVSIESDVVLGE